MKPEDLEQFSGSEQYHYLDVGRFLKCTEGVAFLAKEGNAFWLIDAIASYRRKEPVQFWHLELTEKNGRKNAVLTMREDKHAPVLVEQKIGYTDFPFSVDIWVMDGVALLKSEW